MGLNRSIPSSTEVWWQMRENRSQYNVLSSCKLKKTKKVIIINDLFS
jgi:hypothetical protein